MTLDDLKWERGRHSLDFAHIRTATRGATIGRIKDGHATRYVNPYVFAGDGDIVWDLDALTLQCLIHDFCHRHRPWYRKAWDWIWRVKP
jgi:hypothetical protein